MHPDMHPVMRSVMRSKPAPGLLSQACLLDRLSNRCPDIFCPETGRFFRTNCIWKHNLSGLKRFLMDKLYNIDNLSVKCGSFPDKWSNIGLCHWTVYRTSCIISQRRSADKGNNESISYWVKPNTLRICPLEERKS